MSIAGFGQIGSLARRKPPHRIIVARGERVRSFTIRPWLAGTIAVIGALFGLLYLAATGYLLFRDDLLAASISRQGRMQQAYEDRIASLRGDIDRLTSRQLLNQEAFDAKMDRLLGRQTALDARQDIIAGLSQAARRAGLAATAAAHAADAVPAAASGPLAGAELGGTGKDVPVGGADKDIAVGGADKDIAIGGADKDTAIGGADKDVPIGPADKDLPVTTGSIAPAAGASASIAVAMLRSSASGDPLPPSGAVAKLAAVESSLDALAHSQVAYVEGVATKVTERTGRIAGILKKLGQSLPPPGQTEESVGGPFIPLDVSADPETFRSGVALVTGEIDRLTAARRLAGRLPLERPLPNAPITSGFGARLDPFFGRPAMHPGIDFLAPTGYPVRATAGGTVVTADYAGGYGNMVEIDHGNGVTTRYGHLSAILVRVGQIVPKGALIGRIGSTGRSTGSHLHYEVRLDGTPVNPLAYILDDASGPS
jgi:murein DD-endopeptidase MepM/ murein hydrolase activator NlpD